MHHFPIVYINLAKDEERRHRMQTQSAAMGLHLSRREAVWWEDLGQVEQECYYSAQLNARQYFKPLANGEKGCYSSHIQAWQALLASDAQAMVIFEDDVRLLPPLPGALQAIERLPVNWDMIKLYGRDHEKTARERPIGDGLALIRYQRVPSFCAGYVISRRGAEKLLSSRIPFGRPVDVDLRFWFENDVQIYGVVPSVIALDDTSETSSIWDVRDELTGVQRWRKFMMKLRLWLGNARARKAS